MTWLVSKTVFGKEKRNGVDENKKIKNKNKWKIKLFDWREIEKKK